MSVYAVQWLDPQSGYPADSWHDDEAAAQAAKADLNRRGIRAHVVDWGELEVEA